MMVAWIGVVTVGMKKNRLIGNILLGPELVRFAHRLDKEVQKER